jgi:hypothetical protein
MELDELDADAEDILRGYSLWLRDTNIPKNHAGARDKGEVTAMYMAYSGLKDYLSKTIQVLKDLLPDNQFLSDDNEIELISGVTSKGRIKMVSNLCMPNSDKLLSIHQHLILVLSPTFQLMPPMT